MHGEYTQAPVANSRRDATTASRWRDSGYDCRLRRSQEVKAFSLATGWSFYGLYSAVLSASSITTSLSGVVRPAAAEPRRFKHTTTWSYKLLLKLLSCTGARSILRTRAGMPQFLSRLLRHGIHTHWSDVREKKTQWSEIGFLIGL